MLNTLRRHSILQISFKGYDSVSNIILRKVMHTLSSDMGTQELSVIFIFYLKGKIYR